MWLALMARDRIGGHLFQGCRDKNLSRRQFHSPLMYCGVLIHATWTVSSEGPGVRNRNRLGWGGPLEEVSPNSDHCAWAPMWLMKTQPFIPALGISGLGTTVRGPGLPKGK